jgi:hypothetical protein
MIVPLIASVIAAHTQGTVCGPEFCAPFLKETQKEKKGETKGDSA